LDINLRHQRNSNLIGALAEARQAPSDRYKHCGFAEIWGRRMMKTLFVAEKKIKPGVGVSWKVNSRE
jgi:hypothetical protein